MCFNFRVEIPPHKACFDEKHTAHAKRLPPKPLRYINPHTVEFSRLAPNFTHNTLPLLERMALCVLIDSPSPYKWRCPTRNPLP